MSHRRIPVLPVRPYAHPISGQIGRSYPLGRQNFSRAGQGKELSFIITTTDPLPNHIQACMMTTLNSNKSNIWTKLPFVRTDDHTLTCHTVPKLSGLHSFRAEFSLDNGATWLRDTVPDAWILIDPPQMDRLCIYTYIPTVSGTIADWKTDLRRICDMGFNAIHLLPVTTMGASESPYAAKDLFALDYSYLVSGGNQDGLLQLESYIEEAKSLNIRLCFDLVLNHLGINSTMVKQAPDWIIQDQNQADGFQRARYWSNDGWKVWNDLVLINYEHPSEAIRSEIWAYMTDYALFWAKYANDTGGFVRFDNLHSSNHDFVTSLTATLHADYPEIGILAEYFTDERTLLNSVPQWGLNLILATPWNYKFVPELRGYLNYIHRVSEQVRYYMPITSHDSGSPAQEFGSAASTVPRYVTAALLGTGTTGITQGVEFGEADRIDFIGRKPKWLFPAEARFARFIGQVNAILAEYTAFRGIENYRFVDNGHPAIIAIFRQDTSIQAFGFLVICNFDIKFPQQIGIDLAYLLEVEAPFSSIELLSGEAKIFSQSYQEFKLLPCEAMVLKFHRGR